jgi:hypothetical protein
MEPPYTCLVAIRGCLVQRLKKEWQKVLWVWTQVISYKKDATDGILPGIHAQGRQSGQQIVSTVFRFLTCHSLIRGEKTDTSWAEWSNFPPIWDISNIRAT